MVFGKRALADGITWVGPKSNDGVLLRDNQRRDREKAMQMEAETRVMQPQTQEHLSLWRELGPADTLTFDFQSLKLWENKFQLF